MTEICQKERHKFNNKNVKEVDLNARSKCTDDEVLLNDNYEQL